MQLERKYINNQPDSPACETRLKLVSSLSCESANESAIPREYMEQYIRLPGDIRQRCVWETVSARLLANGGEKLKLAQAMQGGGELVGIDSEGSAMFKDKGSEPVMYGYDEKSQMMRIYNRDPEQMKMVKMWANYSEICAKVTEEGYEMFACDSRDSNGDYGFLSEEMQQVELNTGKQFVASEDRKEWRASWLKSDKRSDGKVWNADFSEVDHTVGVYATEPTRTSEERGVIRLIRV
jgi:hypothetical protein